jgi:hypothetical protein
MIMSAQYILQPAQALRGVVTSAASGAFDRQTSLQPQHQARVGSRIQENFWWRNQKFPHSRSITRRSGETCRVLPASALAAGFPVLLNDVRRVLLVLQPQQAEQVAALLNELSLQMIESTTSAAVLREALSTLQQLSKVTVGDDMAVECENDAALQLLHSWQSLCSAVVACCTGACESQQ